MNKRDLEAVLEEVRNIRSNRKGNELSVGYGNYIEINFCPMYGRYLRK